jgi:hypothetical protein
LRSPCVAWSLMERERVVIRTGVSGGRLARNRLRLIPLELHFRNSQIPMRIKYLGSKINRARNILKLSIFKICSLSVHSFHVISQTESNSSQIYPIFAFQKQRDQKRSCVSIGDVG